MNSSIPLHPLTESELEGFLQRPFSLLVTGAPGCGIKTITEYLVSEITSRFSKVEIIDASTEDKESITVDEARLLLGRLKHRAQPDQLRFIVMNRAERMTNEAQNALLKTFEEPGQNTYFIVATTQPDLLLKTVCSRLGRLEIFDPPANLLREHFSKDQTPSLERLLISTGGRIELIQSLLSNDAPEDDDFKHNISLAKQFLSQTSHERLTSSEIKLADRRALIGLVEALSIVLGSAVRLSARSNNTKQLNSLLEKLEASYKVREALVRNANVKLAATNLCMAI